MKTKNAYSLPCKKEDIEKALSDPIAHKNKLLHAIDFSLLVGSDVLAAQDGEVVRIKDDSNEGGFSEKYRKSPEK
ncbi:MAG: hypothetical protein WD607_08065 [Candidatus Paceibacterota bacterium]